MKIVKLNEEHTQAAAKLCRETMLLDIMPDYLFKEKVFKDKDYNPDLNLLAFNDEDELVGLISGVIRDREYEKVGYIKLLCIKEKDRKKGIGSALYEQVEKKFIDANVNIIRVNESYPNYLSPGIDYQYAECICFFESRGFNKFNKTCNMNVDLLSEDFSGLEDEIKNIADVKFIRGDESYREKIINFVKSYFSSWAEEVDESFLNKPVTLFAALNNEDEVVGFSTHENNNKGIGWFGPTGVRADYRKKGLGRILFRSSLRDMKEMGYVKAIIPWVGPEHFYEKNSNAVVMRTFWRYEKVLK
ncbi:MAG TPA: GNAT family N-acetyltransferase [Ignavibacteriaceae bacterium]|nr:GNAT family N-acetyltransferase [Ignavibacteriaceae bacterium]